MIMLFAIAFQGGPPASTPAATFFKLLENFQAKELIIPFLLTFVIIYGVLDTISLFKKNSINAIIAIAVAFFAISFGPYGAVGKFLMQLYGTGAIAIVGIVVFMIIFGALSLGGTHRPGVGVFGRLFGQSGGVIVGTILVIALVFLLATGWFSNVGLQLDSDTTALIIIVLVIALFFMIVTHPQRAHTWWNSWFPPHPGDRHF